jgi:hypothetical protein
MMTRGDIAGAREYQQLLHKPPFHIEFVSASARMRRSNPLLMYFQQHPRELNGATVCG